VPGERVAVTDVARFEVAAGECGTVAAVGVDDECAALAVDLLDRAAGAVLDAEVVGVAEAETCASTLGESC
jgi:hypothetical protein